MAEHWDIYDENRLPTGKTMVRGAEFVPGEYHLVVHVCVFNAAGQMLIQQRQPFKHGWSGMWDLTCGGAALAGETSRQAARRELYEEVGLALDFTGARPHMCLSFDHGYNEIYIMQAECDPATLTLQYEEVKQVRWASLDDILAMIDTGEFIPYYKEYMRTIFATRSRLGWINGTDRE